MSDKDVSLEDIASLCKRRGFIYQGSEIYGGLSGTWDYGPLGVVLKRNITNLWWQTFIDERDDMYGVDAAILMNQKVWQASGHVDTFTDPLVECSNCKSRFREDHLHEEYKKNNGGMEASISVMPCPVCKKAGKLSSPRQFNMMFETKIGPTADELRVKIPINTVKKQLKVTKDDFVSFEMSRIPDQSIPGYVVYLRPETAQGIFTNYKNVVDSFYPDIPFGIGQVGKAFRNEISPRDFVFRAREFEQMEIEYFVHPKDWEKAFDKWTKDINAFLAKLGLPKDKIHELEVKGKDRAHYSKRTIDFEFDFPHGRKELLGLAYRTDFDLMNIQNNTGKNMAYRDKEGGEPYVPHVIEPSFGVERAIMAVLASAYTKDEVDGESRVYLKLPEHLAPIKIAVSPLLKNKPELVKKAKEVFSQLKKKYGVVTWDDNSNIGKRYRRSDEIGIPKHITIDFDTLEDNTVTIRDRDTTEQTRVDIKDL